MSDLKFNASSPMMIAGPTNCGKTYWVRRLLLNEMFTKPIHSVIYCYGVFQDFYSKLQAEVLKVDIKFELHEGVPSQEYLKSLKDPTKFHVIILDDLMEYIVNDINAQALFTKYCHHYNMTTIFITQNIFAQGRCARTIALNTHVLVLFANNRDRSQIRTLARQQCPTNSRACIEAYEDATSKPYGYLVIDCAPSTEQAYRWRTNIFPDDTERSICYTVKDQ